MFGILNTTKFGLIDSLAHLFCNSRLELLLLFDNFWDIYPIYS